MKKVLVATSMMLFGSSAWALGTDTNAGTIITNGATLSYDAGGTTYTNVQTQNDDSFVVDKKIDMIMTTTDNDQTSVQPGQTDMVTGFQFKNETNLAQKFKFEVDNLNDADSSKNEADYDDDVDTNDVVSMAIEYDDGVNGWQALPANGILELAEDAEYDFRVKATIKTAANGAVDGDIMNIELKATAYKDDTNPEVEDDNTVPDTPGDATDIQVVFADGVVDQTHVTPNPGSATLGDDVDDDTGHKGDTAGDGVETARSGYIVQTPKLSVTKDSCVLKDPVNNEDHPKRIPGAIVRYMFDIKNEGQRAVTNLTINDNDMDAHLDLTDTAASAKKVESQDAVCVCGTVPAAAAAANASVNNGDDLQITEINVAAGSTQAAAGEKHTCVSVEVEIK